MVNLAERFIPERYFPDKAIDVLDESMVRSRISTSVREKKENNDLADIEKKILDLIHQKNQAILNHNYDLSRDKGFSSQRLNMVRLTTSSNNQMSGSSRQEMRFYWFVELPIPSH